MGTVETMPAHCLRRNDDLSMRTIGLMVAIGFGVMTPSRAHAFSEDGFHDGMTLEEVQQQVQKQGHRLLPPFADNGFVTYPVEQVEGMYFDFCKEHLFGYRRPLTDLTAAVKVISENVRDAGQGQYEASMTELWGKANSSMRFMWNIGGLFTGVDISTIRRPDVDPRKKQPSIQTNSTVHREGFQQYWLSSKKCI